MFIFKSRLHVANEKWKLAHLAIKVMASCFRKKIGVIKQNPKQTKNPASVMEGNDAVLYG